MFIRHTTSQWVIKVAYKEKPADITPTPVPVPTPGDNGGNTSAPVPATPATPATPAPSAGTKEVLAKGDTITVKGVKYRVTNVNKKQAEAYAPEKKNAKSLTVANTVTVKGVRCKVTAVSANAFANMKKLTKVTLPKNVVSVGKKAFYKDTKL